MRVIVVDHDSMMLEATVRALREHFVIDAVTNKADCLDLLRQNDFDIIVACERLEDGSGLELLSQVAKRWPAILRVFAADRERLRLLQGRLGPFELFQALAYPINPEKLISTLSLAREAHDADADTTTIQHIVLSGDPSEAAPAAPPPTTPARANTRGVSARTPSASASSATTAPAPTPRNAGTPDFSTRVSSAPTPYQRAASTPSAPVASPPMRTPLSRLSARTTAEASSQPPGQPRASTPATLAGDTRATTPMRFPSFADNSTLGSDSLAEAAGIAATARPRFEPADDRMPASRKAFIAGAVCAIAVVGVGFAALKLQSAPHVAAIPAAPAPVTQQFSKEVTDQVAEVETDFEQGDLRKAQIDIRKLQALAPDHPRLQFFLTLLDRDIRTHGTVAAREKDSAASTRSGSLRKGTPSSSAAEIPSTPERAAQSASAADATPSIRVTAASPGAAAGAASGASVTTAAASDNTAVGNAVPANTAPGNAAFANTASGNAALGNAALGNAALGNAAPGNAVSANAAPGNAVPGNVASGNAASVTTTSLTAAGSGAAPGTSAAATVPAATGHAPATSASTSDQGSSPSAPQASAARPTSTIPVVTAEAQLTHRVSPDYPDAALRKGIEGYVDVHFTITPKGTVTNVAVVSSDPADVFNSAATDAVRHWRYDPRVIDGQPVESQSQVRLQFRLNSNSSLSH